ncbi:hypothetical protein LINGRAHAP2_LOCUS11443 [Linum grandiflorum]
MNGKIFYVTIPCDVLTGGWSAFRCAVESAVGPERRVVVVGSATASLSYADATRVKCLPVEGRCEVVRIGKEESIRVDEAGVAQRKNFLKKCLVVRFVQTAEINWANFRAWARRSWGLVGDVPIRRLGDDLWLVECSTEEEVRRVISLGRWKFGEVMLQGDVWISEAGRSSVAAQRGLDWVLCKEIPIHLRSSDLFRKLRDLCGGFIGVEQEPDLSYVVLKVRRIGGLPKCIPVCCENEVFLIKVLSLASETGAEDPKEEVVTVERCKGKQTAVFQPSSEVVPTSSETCTGDMALLPIMGGFSEATVMGHEKRFDASVTEVWEGSKKDGVHLVGFQLNKKKDVSISAASSSVSDVASLEGFLLKAGIASELLVGPESSVWTQVELGEMGLSHKHVRPFKLVGGFINYGPFGFIKSDSFTTTLTQVCPLLLQRWFSHVEKQSVLLCGQEGVRRLLACSSEVEAENFEPDFLKGLHTESEEQGVLGLESMGSCADFSTGDEDGSERDVEVFLSAVRLVAMVSGLVA